MAECLAEEALLEGAVGAIFPAKEAGDNSEPSYEKLGLQGQQEGDGGGVGEAPRSSTPAHPHDY